MINGIPLKTEQRKTISREVRTMDGSMPSVTIYHGGVGHTEYNINLHKDVWRSSPNSAGGLSYKFNIKNNTDKTIKYVTITVSVYNSVSDKVSDSISGKSLFSLKLTGPLNAYSTYEDVIFENFMYNSTGKSARIESVTVEYMDGTEEDVSLSEMFDEAIDIYHSEMEKNMAGNGPVAQVCAVIGFIIFFCLFAYFLYATR